jgi:hypothetical protein
MSSVDFEFEFEFAASSRACACAHILAHARARRLSLIIMMNVDITSVHTYISSLCLTLTHSSFELFFDTTGSVQLQRTDNLVELGIHCSRIGQCAGGSIRDADATKLLQ